MAVTIQFMTRRIKVSGEAFKKFLGIQTESRTSGLLALPAMESEREGW